MTSSNKAMLDDVAGIGATNNPKFLIVHHTGGSDAAPLADTSHHTFEMVNKDHQARGFPKSSLGFYIGYHYFIDYAGVVKQGRADRDIGAHTIGENDKSIGICLAGNFDATLPTPQQEQSLKKLLNDLAPKYSIPAENIVPHRHFAVKTCYGKRIADDWAKNLLTPIVNPDLQKFIDLQAQQLELFKKNL